MSNTCRNVLLVEGEKEHLDRFIEEAKHYDGASEGEKRGTELHLFGFNVVDFARLSEVSARYWFETPWRPPVFGINAMGQEFPMLRFDLSYVEPLAGFKGKWKCENVVMTGKHEPFDLYAEENVVEEAADSLESPSSPEGGKPENGEAVVECPTEDVPA